MRMSFRWFGKDDPVPLEHIRQIPGVRGIVSALYDVPVGDTWSRESISRLIDAVTEAGMPLSVVESIPVHEDIKLGRPNAASDLADLVERIAGGLSPIPAGLAQRTPAEAPAIGVPA